MTHAIIKVSDREHATILAAVRFWQRYGSEYPDLRRDTDEWEIACNGAQSPLGPVAIDTLCERINGDRSYLGRVAVSLEGGLLQDFFTDDPELRGRLDLLVIDYDNEGADEADLIGVRQRSGEYADALVSERGLSTAEVGFDEISRQLDFIDYERARNKAMRESA